MGGVSYVLAQRQPAAPEGIAYLRCWTAIGPCQTVVLAEAQRFVSEEAANAHPAATFRLTFYRACPVVGSIVGRPLEWLEDEVDDARRELEGESAADGLRVFA